MKRNFTSLFQRCSFELNHHFLQLYKYPTIPKANMASWNHQFLDMHCFQVFCEVINTLVNSGWAVWCGAGQRLSQVFRFLHSCRIFAWAPTCLGSICAKTSFDMFCTRLCLQCVRRSKPGAFHVIALCCNSFCMPASSSHGRSILFPLGNENYEFVQQGNLLASRMTLLMLYSLAKTCRFLLEQPGGSALPLHPRVSSFFDRHYVWNASIWGGCLCRCTFGSDT